VPHRDVADAWLTALAAALPLPGPQGSRRRPALTFAAPLPVGVAAERELADLYLAERLPSWQVREAVSSAAPAGITVASIHDVWLLVPPLAASVIAADYRVVLASGCRPDAIRGAAARLLAAPTLERRRPRGSESVVYDLRPLVAAIDIDDDQPVVRIRTRFDRERGTGRPEEVLAALADALGEPLEARETVRERVLLADDVEPEGDATAERTFDERLTAPRA
jgi:radical SAM-linked protein